MTGNAEKVFLCTSDDDADHHGDTQAIYIPPICCAFTVDVCESEDDMLSSLLDIRYVMTAHNLNSYY